MVKLKESYIFLKNQDINKKYLFKNGNFYIFIGEDAEYISLKYNLKISSLGYTKKCGFPINSLDKYMNKFKAENIMIITDNSMECIVNRIIELFNKVDINNISFLEAFDLVRKVKEVVYNGQN